MYPQSPSSVQSWLLMFTAPPICFCITHVGPTSRRIPSKQYEASIQKRRNEIRIPYTNTLSLPFFYRHTPFLYYASLSIFHTPENINLTRLTRLKRLSVFKAAHKIDSIYYILKESVVPTKYCSFQASLTLTNIPDDFYKISICQDFRIYTFEQYRTLMS